MNIYVVMFYYLTSEDIRHYVLANLLCQSWLLLAIENWSKQTNCVSYSTNTDTVLLNYLTSEDSRHYMLANLLC